MRNATLRQLRVFESAARHLSLTRAAEELHLTAPAVSIQVKQLEGHAGAALFERSGRGLRLTQAGAEVLRHAREILGHIRAAEEAIAELDALERGLLDVAVINAGDHFFPWIVAAFRARASRDPRAHHRAEPRRADCPPGGAADRPRGHEPAARPSPATSPPPSRRTRT